MDTDVSVQGVKRADDVLLVISHEEPDTCQTATNKLEAYKNTLESSGSPINEDFSRASIRQVVRLSSAVYYEVLRGSLPSCHLIGGPKSATGNSTQTQADDLISKVGCFTSQNKQTFRIQTLVSVMCD